MTAFYSKVGTLQFKDKTLSFKADFRVRIVELRRLSCSKGCFTDSTRGEVERAHATKMHTVWQVNGTTRSGKSGLGWRGPYIEDWDERAKKLHQCPNCAGDLVNTKKLAYKIYFPSDKRINMAWLLGTSCSLQYAFPSESLFKHVDADQGPMLTFRKGAEFFGQRYRKSTEEYYRIVDTYEHLRQLCMTLRVYSSPTRRQNTEKKKLPWPKCVVTYTPVAVFPDKAVFEEEYNGALARRLGKVM